MFLSSATASQSHPTLHNHILGEYRHFRGMGEVKRGPAGERGTIRPSPAPKRLRLPRRPLSWLRRRRSGPARASGLTVGRLARSSFLATLSCDPLHGCSATHPHRTASGPPGTEFTGDIESLEYMYIEIDVANLTDCQLRNLSLLPLLDRARRMLRIRTREWKHMLLNFNGERADWEPRLYTGPDYTRSMGIAQAVYDIPPPPSYEWTLVMQLPEPIDLAAMNLVSIVHIRAIAIERWQLQAIKDYSEKRLGVLEHTLEYSSASLRSCYRSDISL